MTKLKKNELPERDFTGLSLRLWLNPRQSGISTNTAKNCLRTATNKILFFRLWSGTWSYRRQWAQWHLLKTDPDRCGSPGTTAGQHATGFHYIRTTITGECFRHSNATPMADIGCEPTHISFNTSLKLQLLNVRHQGIGTCAVIPPQVYVHFVGHRTEKPPCLPS